MDLSRAKTILIVAFLGLNLFLGYKLWLSTQPLRQSSVLTSEEIEQAQNLLAENGFELATSVPNQIPQLALLHVSRAQTHPFNWIETFFGDKEIERDRSIERIVYAFEGELLEVWGNGHVIYKTDQEGTGAEATRALAERYLRDWKLWNSDIKFDMAIPDPQEGVRYRFVKTYQGFPLFSSAIEVYLKDGIAAEVKFDQATPISFAERDVTVISALSAIETFVQKARRFENKQVVDISLGYYSLNYNANRWEIAPVWRIATADGQAVYVNAFTGKPEESNL